MSYEPQPGTIPHRAVQWLRSMDSLYPGREYPTPEVCEALEIETLGFTAYMGPSRTHGLVKARTKPETGKLLHWSLGDGKPDVQQDRDRPLVRDADAVPIGELRGEALPGVTELPEPSTFRALMWEGHVLATGMEIRNGVAIFTPEQVWELKRSTDWARPPESYEGAQA